MPLPIINRKISRLPAPSAGCRNDLQHRPHVRQRQSRIDADNQQHEDYRSSEEEQRVALIADNIVVKRPTDDKVPFGAVIGKLLRPRMEHRRA
jgi:hypothetical protein